MTEKQYAQLVKKSSPKSPVVRDCLIAFAVGGTICALGQGIMNFWMRAGFSAEDAGSLASMSLVAVSALMTGLSLYDNLAQYAGAGTLVPITGFANAIAAPAVEFRTEGFILGVGARIFTIAGPVILYGLSASVVYGVCYYFLSSF